MLRAPFPYFGSKRHAAHLIWQALGDVASYCEPFCGSAAVLLARPGGAGRIETINDMSGHFARVLTPAALCATFCGGSVGILLDPPYLETAQTYAADGTPEVARAAAAWALQAASDFPSWRIVLAGYEGDNEMPGWRCIAWDPSASRWGGGPKGKTGGTPQRERLWLSPACLPVEGERGHQPALFAGVA